MDGLLVVMEVASKRSFACALRYPGWFGHGKNPEGAIDRLLAYRNRYASIAIGAGIEVPTDTDVNIVEQLVGDATTEFGAPGQIATMEWAVSEVDLQRLRVLHAACRGAFVAAAGQAPEQLVKGPRGGGRDTSRVVGHISAAEKAYASKLHRGAWPEAYYLRRSAYHYADHAWEIEDRTPT